MSDSISKKTVELITIKSEKLDPIRVIFDDISPGAGRVFIGCYGKAWECFWPAMGERTIKSFFCGCNNEYIINRMSDIEKYVLDEDTILDEAEKKGIEQTVDSVRHDYPLLSALYGPDPMDWSLPKIINHEYKWLSDIIDIIKEDIDLI